MSQSVKNSIDKIINWYKINSPDIISHLNPPATDNEINELEIKTGINIPDSYKELLKTFNGEDSQLFSSIFGDGNMMLSCENSISQFEMGMQIGKAIYLAEMNTVDFWKDRVSSNVIFIKGAVKPLQLHPKWLPFSCMNGDVFRYLDFDPAPGGVMGQVIEVDPEACSYQVLADSLGIFLENYAQQLENSEYIVNEDGYTESTNKKDETTWGIPQWLK